jgi:hypothetical protein
MNGDPIVAYVMGLCGNYLRYHTPRLPHELSCYLTTGCTLGLTDGDLGIRS